MYHRWIRRLLAGGAVWMAAATGAQAQLNDVTATAYSGMAIPMGAFADYASMGMTGGVQFDLPIFSAVGVVARGELEQLNGGAPGMPDFQLWRYQAGAQADLLGRPMESWGLRGYLGVGATTVRSGGYYFPGNANLHSFAQTSLTGTAGLELIYGASSDIHGYVGARLHWMPIDEDESASLASAALRGPLDPLDSAMTVPVTLGLRIRLS